MKQDPKWTQETKAHLGTDRVSNMDIMVEVLAELHVLMGQVLVELQAIKANTAK